MTGMSENIDYSDFDSNFDQLKTLIQLLKRKVCYLISVLKLDDDFLYIYTGVQNYYKVFANGIYNAVEV